MRSEYPSIPPLAMVLKVWRARELIAQLASLVEENDDAWIIQDDLNAGG